MGVLNFDELLLSAKDEEIARLRADNARLGGENVKLWRAVADLQFAAGTATAWSNLADNSTPGDDEFNTAVENAANQLDGVVSLVLAE